MKAAEYRELIRPALGDQRVSAMNETVARPPSGPCCVEQRLRFFSAAFLGEQLPGCGDEGIAQVRAALDVTVSTDVAPSDARPRYVFDLRQNFPNPFNPVTTVRYSVGKESHVDIAVFDVGGRRVRSLVDETQVAGLYDVTWDGRDHHGAELAAGVYWIRLEAGEHRFARKAVLLK